MALFQVVCSVLSEQLEKLKNPDTTSLSCEEGCVEWSLVVPSVDQYQDHSGFTSAQQAGKVFTLLLSHYTPDRSVSGVGWLLTVPDTCQCVSGMDLLRQLYILPHWDRRADQTLLPHPVTVY